MRLLSILCGLSFSVMAGYFMACSLLASLWGLPAQNLTAGSNPLVLASLALALLGAFIALRSRCEGWVQTLGGCSLFLISQVLAPHLGAPNLAAVLCLCAAGLALLPLLRTPASYWRVAG